MTKSLSRSVRFMFASLVLTLTAYTVLESAVGASPVRADAQRPVAAAPAPAPEGLSVCGSEESPCLLDAITVELQASDTHLASSGRAPAMSLRVRS
jgi:hypothetical protein